MNNYLKICISNRSFVSIFNSISQFVEQGIRTHMDINKEWQSDSWKVNKQLLMKNQNKKVNKKIIISNLPALSLTVRLGSFKALIKVVCNWGKNGFRRTPAFSKSPANVSKTAVFTLAPNLSPRIRIKGPVICTTEKRKQIYLW